MLRSYEVNCPLNIVKKNKILDVFKEYNNVSKTVNKLQWNNFYNSGKFTSSKHLDIKSIKGNISQRYKRNVVIQITGILDSFLSNLQNKFVKLVYKTNLSNDIIKDLLYINKLNLWFYKKDFQSTYIDKKTKQETTRTISYKHIKLSRKIFNQLLKYNKKPNISIHSIHLNLDIISITEDNSNKKHNKTTFDLWGNLSTLEKGKKINLPFKTNKYINKNFGKIKNYIQITKTIEDSFQFNILKDIESKKDLYLKDLKRKYKKNKGIKEIGIDLGLRKLFVTSTNNYYGNNFIDKLIEFDTEIVRLLKEKQKHKLSFKKSRKYRKYVKKLKSFIKNEVNKNINKIIKNEKPSKLILESLNFQSPSLSKKLNRILQNFGKSIITKKLEQINEEYGIIVEYINPMYSSQSCSKCDYVDKNNRKGQEEFSCIYCNLEKNRKKLKLNIVEFMKNLTIEITKNKTNSSIKFFYLDKKLNMKLVKINADYNASKNIYGRSSSVNNDTNIGIYDKKAVVLGKITGSFIRKLPESHYSLIEDLGNSYFDNYFHGKRTNNSIKILNKS